MAGGPAAATPSHGASKPSEPSEADIEAAILALVESRRPGSSICPGEVARRVRPNDWRPSMPTIRRVSIRMAQQGIVAILEAGAPVDLSCFRGPIRLARPV